MDPLHTMILRGAIEAEIARVEGEYPPSEDEDVLAWAYGRMGGLRLVLTWLERLEAGKLPELLAATGPFPSLEGDKP